MGKYLQGVTEYFRNIEAQAAAESNPHRRAILKNYLTHAALEYTDRWPEIFSPERTIAHPIYKVRWGTPEEVVYDGPERVQDFYRTLKDDTFLTNQDELLAVNDWGFASFLTINLFMNAAKARSMGLEPNVEANQYVLATQCSMYWTYDQDARLMGEYVYEIGAGQLAPVAPQDEISFDDVQKVVAGYLPPQP
ncbi:hypothetical protein [Pseudomonas sp.]|uniref:hypothetical protein n=1 Tax=Pseudomonas sp. TaxID=306 RepID=UPI003D111F41